MFNNIFRDIRCIFSKSVLRFWNKPTCYQKLARNAVFCVDSSVPRVSCRLRYRLTRTGCWWERWMKRWTPLSCARWRTVWVLPRKSSPPRSSVSGAMQEWRMHSQVCADVKTQYTFQLKHSVLTRRSELKHLVPG